MFRSSYLMLVAGSSSCFWVLNFDIVMFNNLNILLILLMFLSHFIDLIESMQRELCFCIYGNHMVYMLTYVRMAFVS